MEYVATDLGTLDLIRCPSNKVNDRQRRHQLTAFIASVPMEEFIREEERHWLDLRDAAVKGGFNRRFSYLHVAQYIFDHRAAVLDLYRIPRPNGSIVATVPALTRMYVPAEC